MISTFSGNYNLSKMFSTIKKDRDSHVEAPFSFQFTKMQIYVTSEVLHLALQSL